MTIRRLTQTELYRRERSLHEGRRHDEDLTAMHDAHQTKEQRAEYARRQAQALPAYVRALREAQPVKAGVSQMLTRKGRRATMADPSVKCASCGAPLHAGEYRGRPATTLACSACGGPVGYVEADDTDMADPLGPINADDSVDADDSIDADDSGYGDADRMEELEDSGADTTMGMAGPGSGRSGNTDLGKMISRSKRTPTTSKPTPQFGEVSARNADGSPRVLSDIQQAIRREQRRRANLSRPVL